MAKFMRTIADRRDEISRENLSSQPLLTNDYTYGNINETSENIANKMDDESDLEAEIISDKTVQKTEPKTTARTDMDKMKEKYPVQQVCEASKKEFTVDEIQDAVDELNVDSGTRDRG